MLIKRNDIQQKMESDNAIADRMTIDDIQNALVELAELYSTQEDALVELAEIMTEE